MEYQASAPDGPWLPSKYCRTCVTHLLNTQWGKYVDQLKKVTCKAEQKRLLGRGPPINLRDRIALPCPGPDGEEDDDDHEVQALWFADGGDQSPKLKGSLVGEARQAFWDEQLEFEFEGDKDEDEAAEAKK